MIEIKKRPLTPDQQRKRAERCRELSDDIDDIKKTLRQLSAERRQKLRQANALRVQAKARADREFNNRKISFLFDAVGIAISGGSASTVRRAIGNVLSTIGNIFGFTSTGEQVNRILQKVDWLMSEFEDLGGQMDHLTNGMARMERDWQKLDC